MVVGMERILTVEVKVNYVTQLERKVIFRFEIESV